MIEAFGPVETVDEGKEEKVLAEESVAMGIEDFS